MGDADASLCALCGISWHGVCLSNLIAMRVDPWQELEHDLHPHTWPMDYGFQDVLCRLCSHFVM